MIIEFAGTDKSGKSEYTDFVVNNFEKAKRGPDKFERYKELNQECCLEDPLKISEKYSKKSLEERLCEGLECINLKKEHDESIDDREVLVYDGGTSTEVAYLMTQVQKEYNCEPPEALKFIEDFASELERGYDWKPNEDLTFFLDVGGSENAFKLTENKDNIGREKAKINKMAYENLKFIFDEMDVNYRKLDRLNNLCEEKEKLERYLKPIL